MTNQRRGALGRFLDRIRARYSNDSITVQEKAVSLVLLNASLTVGFLALGLIRILDGSLLLGGLELFISAFVLLLVILINHGRFRFASVATIILFLLAAAGLFLLREIGSPNDIYIQTTYMIPVFTTAPLLAFATVQVVVILVAGSGVVILQYLLRVRPALISLGLDDGLSEFLVAFLLTVFSALFTYQIFRMQRRTLNMVTEEAGRSRGLLDDIAGLLERVGSGFNVGAKLQEAARENTVVSDDMADNLTVITRHIGGLGQSIADTSNSSGRIERAMESVKTVMDEQTRAIESTASTMTGLGGQVHRMSDELRERAEVVRELVATSQEGNERLERASQSFAEMDKISSQVLAVVSVIQQVAARTNLLAMNAAIEAAHAGDAGRGFAVVAEEIRSLADETNQNSRIIRETLKENREIHERTQSENEALVDAFAHISRAVSDVDQVIASTSEGLERLATGHTTIGESTETLRGVNDRVRTALAEMRECIEQETEGITDIRSRVEEIERTITSLRDHADRVNTLADEIEAIGKTNVANFQELQEGIARIQNEE